MKGNDPKKIKEFRHESLEDTSSLVSYLRALTAGLEAGELRLADGSGELTLRPKGLLHFELRALKKRGRARVVVDVDWLIADKDDLAENPLQIQPGPPPGDGNAE